MLHFDLSIFQEAFDVNWRDWCFRDNVVQWKPYRLLRYDRVDLSIKDVLSKNPDETRRWHIAFLQGDEDLYYQEYLHDDAFDFRDAEKRAHKFREIMIDVKKNGVLKPVWVAKVNDMFFRFDGCHRTCCAHVCGMETVPALVFKTEELK